MHICIYNNHISRMYDTSYSMLSKTTHLSPAYKSHIRHNLFIQLCLSIYTCIRNHTYLYIIMHTHMLFYV